MKNSAAGANVPKLCIGLWVIALTTLTWPNLSEGLPGRRNWIFEQLSVLGQPTLPNEKRHLVFLHAVNLSAAISTGLSANIDLDWFEVRFTGANRSYIGTGRSANQTRFSLVEQHQNIGVEIARYAIASRQYYGRIAVGEHFFFPTGHRKWISVKMDTGVLNTPVFPWELHLQAAGYVPIHEDDIRIVIGFDLTKSIQNTNFLVGGFASWTHLIRQGTPPVGIYEHMLFSLGPIAKWKNSWGSLNAELRWRVVIDKEIFRKKGIARTGFPSEISAFPDVGFTWNIVF